MADFTVRSDSVNVEQIMEQIRARIREKRGVDYTEQQIRELAAVKLEKFLDPRGVRSDLLEQFRRRVQPAYEPPELPNFAFEEETLFESHRALIRWIRRLLRPLLKLFFNPNPLIQALHIQSRLNALNALNAERDARREEAARRGIDQLSFEVMHNLVIETTRLGIDVKNLKMRVESLASRLEFNERRARALESVVVYKPSREDQIGPAAGRPTEEAGASHPSTLPQAEGRPEHGRGATGSGHAPSTSSGQAPSTGFEQAPSPGSGSAGPPEGPGQRSRRRRRRRGRRGGAPAVAVMGDPSTSSGQAPSTGSGQAPDPDASSESPPDAAPRLQGEGEPTPPPASSVGSAHDQDRPDHDRETTSSGHGEPDPEPQ